MDFPQEFYMTQSDYCTYEKHVNAPIIRKEIEIGDFTEAEVIISGLGFYKLYINGKEIRKGILAPYISNPDDYVYFDRFDVAGFLSTGKNAVCIILGNGMQNANGGRVWDFDIARFRGAPRFAFSLKTVNANGDQTLIQADESFRWFPSPIIFDDLRSGCFYDANLECAECFLPGFDDSAWNNVIKAENPRGKFKICDADPVVITEEIRAVSIKECKLSADFNNRSNMRLDTQYKFNCGGKDGVVFDFGINTAGIFRLKIDGKKGQQIFIQLCEFETTKGEPCYVNTGSFYPDGYGQTALYICKGEKGEVFEPSFTYFGYRYAFVSGLEKEQINDDTLVMLRANSNLKERANFTCSDPVMNKLCEMSRISDLANFYYFPTDCPHREKNGWTGDAAVSCERILLTLTPENSYIEWLRNICASQRKDGALPGIIPTGGWGFDWGNGPAWDNVLTELCWQIYRLRGDLEPARECSESIFRYLSYISQKRRDDGLIAIGLGDWLQPGKGAGDPTAPLYLTDSVISMYICRKSADLFKALGLDLQYEFAENLCNSFKNAIRNNLIDFSSMTVRPRCETAQAICIYYGVFEKSEIYAASKVLSDICREKNEFIDCGMIGLRTIFHVLSDAGETELAYKMITRREYPSYGHFIENGFTSLPEDFLPDDRADSPNSLNHHFFGDIISWFIQRVVGIRVNPRNTSCNDFDISPAFIESLDFAKAYYNAPCGKISVEWNKEANTAEISIDCTDDATGYILLPEGWYFRADDTESSLHGSSMFVLKKGKYIAEKAI